MKLRAAANQLVLEPAQVAGLNTAMATIVANYVSHWNTGQAQPFMARSLLGVIAAIDSFADCFGSPPPRCLSAIIRRLKLKDVKLSRASGYRIASCAITPPGSLNTGDDHALRHFDPSDS
ncbi:hypothetical protein EDE09_11079 [Neorhizobium sp. S3-V5DH]|nr:hypothetical protein EDE09_11079 [Neorhizobium sp. S3-V5DH]